MGIAVRADRGRRRIRRIGRRVWRMVAGISALACVSLGLCGVGGVGLNSAHASDDLPKVSFVKAAMATQVTRAGQSVRYVFEVKNTGARSLRDIQVKDSRIPSLSCGPFSLAPGAKRDCWATYTVTAADMEFKVLSNRATLTATDDTGTKVSAEAQRDVPVNKVDSLVGGVTVEKTTSIGQLTAAGQNVPYTFTVTNSGDLALTDVIVSDPMFGGEVSGCGPWTLQRGESQTCEATYRVTQEDMDRGVVHSKVTATGILNTGEGVTGSTATDTSAIQRGSWDITKTSATTHITRVGQLVTYQFQVVNNGTVTTHDVRVSDPMFGGAVAGCGPWALMPGQSATCQAIHRVTQADVDAGPLTNTATVSGKDPGGNDVPPKSATLTIPVMVGNASISVNMVPNTIVVAEAGQKVAYDFQIRNTGPVTLTNVTLAEVAPGVTMPHCGPWATLAPGQTVTCSGKYTTTQADIDAGRITHAATVTGTTPDGTQLNDTDTATTRAAGTGSVDIVKSVTTPTPVKVGQQVDYRFRVTNMGTTTLTGVSVADRLPGVALNGCSWESLKPGQSVTCSGTYQVTQADVAAGVVANVATVHGVNVNGPVDSAPSATEIPVSKTEPPTVKPPTVKPPTVEPPTAQTPSVELAKSSTTTTITKAGQKVVYDFRVTNKGNVPLTGVRVTDPLPGIVLDCATWTLAPGESKTCQGTYTVTQADMDAGKVVSTATATGQPPTGDPVSGSSTSSAGVRQSPKLRVVKTAQVFGLDGREIKRIAKPGERIVYKFTVTNVGNLTAYDVTVDDQLKIGQQGQLTPVDYLGKSRVLKPGEQQTYTANYVVAQADLNAGQVVNAATVTANRPGPGGVPGPETYPPAPPSEVAVLSQPGTPVIEPPVNPGPKIVTGGTVIG